jgi:hypothetical protein
MAVTAESVIVELEGRFGKFEAEARQAAGSFEAAVEKIKGSANRAELATQKMATGIGTLKASVVGFLGAITVDKVIQLTSASLDYAASIGETAQQLGVTTKLYQELGFAATQVGIKQETLESALAKLTRTLGEAKAGSEQQVKAFAALGISAEEIQQLNTDEAFRRIADALAKIPDPAKRAAIEVDLFGKSGQKLDTLLAGGTAAIDELAEAANKLGVVLSDEQLQKADETADKLAALQKVLSANIAGIVADNANAILKIASAVGEVVSNIGELLKLIEAADLAKKRLEAGDFAGAFNARRDVELASQGPQIDLSFGNSAAFGGFTPARSAAPTATGAANRTATVRTPRTAAQSKPELTPAQQRDLADFSPTADSLAALLDPGELQTSLGVLGEIKTVAVDLSNVDIIDQQAIDAAAEFSKNLTDGLALAIVNGQNLGDALVNSIKAAAAELIASGLLKLLTGGLGAATGGIGGFLGGIFGGFRAGGGPVTSGRPYVVGERGPELFVPSGNGNVRPAGSFGGNQPISFNQTISVSLAGNAATKEDAAAFARIAYEKSLEAVKQMQTLGIPSL